MVLLIIDSHLIDSINIFAVLVSIMGFLYLTKEFFTQVGWLDRVLRRVLPTLLGILILAPIGIAAFAYFYAPLLNGAILYGLVGAMIGFFNGSFVEEWPPKAKKLTRFSWKDALIGFLVSSLVWFVIGQVFRHSPVDAVFIGGVVGLGGGVVAGFWRFLNLEPQRDPKDLPPPSKEAVAWNRRLKLAHKFALAVLFEPPMLSKEAADFWHSVTWQPPHVWCRGLLRLARRSLRLLGAKPALRQRLYNRIVRWEPPCSQPSAQRYSWCAFSLKRGLIGGTALGVVLGGVQFLFLHTILWQVGTTGVCLALAGIMAFGLWRKAPPVSQATTTNTAAAAPAVGQLGTSPVAESEAQHKEVPYLRAESSPAPHHQAPGQAPPAPGEATSAASVGEAAGPRPPLFSAGGFFLGLVSALLLGSLMLLVADFALGASPQRSLSASLTHTSFIWPAGAIIGAFSRYFFWWLKSHPHDWRLGAGVIITILGFCLQLLPPLLDLLK